MWYLHGSNMGHLDLQSSALPTELRYHKINNLDYLLWAGLESNQHPRIFSPVRTDHLRYQPILKMFKLHDIFQSPPNQKLQLSPGCIVSAQLSLKHL